ncbi:transglycosylase SLT domain-containing protein [Croceicoccus sp. Ery15]|uniref:transglycosylase SLT domain-containing protein n=1 Tax=Croceicoccus sp. Ery15 TaxID=1703338 RepID=UPI001E4EF531|nr:transglycosylase SLT domain-containing protein [Croceicoccus sp. Ery15]
MSGPPIEAVSGTGTAIRADIARAAQRTGEDFEFLLAQARIESSMNPDAKAATSSAAGLFQFTNATWLGTLERHGAKHGYGWASAAISDGRITDKAMAERIMGLRYDPAASALMAGELAGDNRIEMARTLGRQPDAAELYLAHFLGSGDAARFLNALSRDPDASATALLPAASAANRGIFRHPSGAERSLGEVMAVIEAKVQGAMNGAGEFVSPLPHRPAQPGPGLPVPGALPVAARIAGGQSMTARLQSIFGDTGQSTPPAVKAAYARFERFGL